VQPLHSAWVEASIVNAVVVSLRQDVEISSRSG
jgi:hypothetical protein